MGNVGSAPSIISEFCQTSGLKCSNWPNSIRFRPKSEKPITILKTMISRKIIMKNSLNLVKENRKIEK